ncbi:hypothetical protein BST27_07475 [Mycobacterium intermedium]|uniref:Uncharacterized protein n=1 Tax=Mycobacterium intermedium TaxID=28445 RepID=A0A1E3SCQ8_MYCIE|nr:hypothetical protein [Mycobacterium intermedium]MCV6966513.1 hypothetical protein [Mycobacterium intermedium]ODQ99955.1 hypothetical protein BHQ20_15310 [Mycobacterium intermedium]OPE48624.1 hypothetical protein BV508_17280 [Mycobacterium intermedium]ORB08235.1 hypothetical protein BST27_07475 [Mycobacterium intermedium]
MTIAIDTHDPVEKYVADEHEDFISAVASINAIGGRGDNDRVETKPRWRPTEEEIVRAAIAVIFISLMALIGLAAGAFLTVSLTAA